jgi:hypothetical protein
VDLSFQTRSLVAGAAFSGLAPAYASIRALNEMSMSDLLVHGRSPRRQSACPVMATYYLPRRRVNQTRRQEVGSSALPGRAGAGLVRLPALEIAPQLADAEDKAEKTGQGGPTESRVPQLLVPLEPCGPHSRIFWPSAVCLGGRRDGIETQAQQQPRYQLFHDHHSLPCRSTIGQNGQKSRPRRDSGGTGRLSAWRAACIRDAAAL